jgi:hypothetical protein
VKTNLATDFEKNGQVSQDRLTQHRLAQDKEKSRKDRLLGKTVKEKVDKKELFTLIKSALPRLDESEISETEKMISGFSLEEIKLIFQPGTYITNQGRRIQTAYIRTAPEVYKALSEEKQEDFCRWISLARKVSGLSFSCLEGFLNSSVQIITRKGLPVLEYWTEHGISLTRKSNTFAIAYFNHTAGLITSQVISVNFNPESLNYYLNTCQEQDSSDLYTSSYEFIPARTRPEIGSGVSVDSPFCSTQPYEPYLLCPLINSQPPDFEKFKELVSIGENLAGSNQKLAEAYF